VVAAELAVAVWGRELVLEAAALGRRPSPGASAAPAGDFASGASSGGGKRRPDPPLAPSPYRYVTLSVATLRGIHLLVFAYASVAQHITQLQTASAATGMDGVLGSKGGVATGMVYKKATSLAFVSAHLAARPERMRERGDNNADICRNVRLTTAGGGGAQFPHQFDHVFLMGDVNYRIDTGAMGTPDKLFRVLSHASALWPAGGGRPAGARAGG
jgi:hypothetical protein